MYDVAAVDPELIVVKAGDVRTEYDVTADLLDLFDLVDLVDLVDLTDLTDLVEMNEFGYLLSLSSWGIIVFVK